MDITFNTNGNEKQKDCARAWLNDEISDIVYGGGKGGGKSYVGCSLIAGDALMYADTFYFVARKKLADLRKFTLPSFQEVFQAFGITDKYYKFNGQDNYIQFYNKSRIYFLDAKFLPSDPQYMRFGSMQMTRGWIEEAGEFELECKNNLQASIGRYNNIKYKLAPKLLMTCNPAKNFLYPDYYKPHFENKIESHRKFIQALPSDNKMLPENYVAGLLKILSPNEIQRLIYGNWEFDDNPYALFDYADILGIFTNEFVLPTEQRYMTCDLAYEGADKFVIVLWAGLVVKKIIAIDKINDVSVSKKIHELRIQYGVPLKNVVYDADGLQTFTRNSAKEGNLLGAKPFHNNGVPIKVSGKKENFKNLKTQCYFLFAEHVKENKIFIEDKAYRKQIIEELEQINRNPYDDDGKFSMEKKDEIRKRLGRSCDFADSLMLRFVYEINAVKKVAIVW